MFVCNSYINTALIRVQPCPTPANHQPITSHTYLSAAKAANQSCIYGSSMTLSLFLLYLQTHLALWSIFLLGNFILIFWLLTTNLPFIPQHLHPSAISILESLASSRGRRRLYHICLSSGPRYPPQTLILFQLEPRGLAIRLFLRLTLDRLKLFLLVLTVLSSIACTVSFLRRSFSKQLFEVPCLV